MNIFKNKRGKGTAANQDVDMDYAGLNERKRFWVICTTFLLSGIFILVYSIASNNADSVTKFMGHRLNMADQGLVTMIMNRQDRSPIKIWHNLFVEESSNYFSTLANLLHMNGTSDSECYHVKTSKIMVEGLPQYVDGEFFFQTDMTHHLTLLAYEENGKERCAGGDYYEVDFHDRYNVIYKSRLPTVDFGNGSYGLELFVPSRFAGAFTLEIWLLFSNYHGLDNYMQEGWAADKDPPVLVMTLELQMGVGGDLNIESPHDQALDLKNLTQCTQADFYRTTWQGRWTRSWYNADCTLTPEKQVGCLLPEEHYWCEEPWCFGPIGRLSSNGWQYSAHCSFKIFEREEAWKCLQGKWILLWGDSNSLDIGHNLLLFVLGWLPPVGKTLKGGLADFQAERIYDFGLMNPLDYDQEVRLSQIFNGHHNVSDNFEGMDSLRHWEHQKLLLDRFKGKRWPDIVIMNSGIHDAFKPLSVEKYSEAADFTIAWWRKLYDSIPADRKPQLVWRTNTAPPGETRKSVPNPSQMEMFNLLIVEKFHKIRDTFPVKIIDAFDLSFPFHYTNEYSDGGHYGIPPGGKFGPWSNAQPHWYFVELMVTHSLLNAICPSQA